MRSGSPGATLGLKRNIKIRMKEHKNNYCNDPLDKSSVARHAETNTINLR